MNDRHRMIERCRKKQQRKRQYAYLKQGTTAPDIEATLSKLAEAVAPAIKRVYEAMMTAIQKAVDAVNEYAEYIKAMSEEEFNEKLVELEQELTPEQIELLKRIRGDGPDERPNNPTESMGE